MRATGDGRRDVKRQRTGLRDGSGRDAVISAALRTFADRGYYGSSIRDIAAEADMTAASLYHHFSSKQEILRVVMVGIMQDALASTREALLRSGGTASDQLTALMRAWVEFHSTRQVEARVGAADLHCLEPDGRRVVVALRDEQEQMFVSVVRRGIEDGEFHTPHLKEAARALINMGTAVATWYRQDGPVTPDALGRQYAELALALVERPRADTA